MKEREYNQLIYEIFRGVELTSTKHGEWIINKYDPIKSILLDPVFCSNIIDRYEYLQHDSGNFYTGETHFRLLDLKNLKTIPYKGDPHLLKRVIRKVRLFRLMK